MSISDGTSSPSMVFILDEDPVFQRQFTEVVARMAGEDAECQIESPCRFSNREIAGADFTIVLDPALTDKPADYISALRARGHGGRILIATAQSSIRDAVLLVRAGADDIIIKPANAATIEQALGHLQKTGYRGAHSEPRYSGTDFGPFVGKSRTMLDLYRWIDAVAPSSAPVFITGESGTGKELTAQAIHEKGPRNGGPMVTINCSAIPAELMESEIFGHVKGAFTGAVADRTGAAEQADGGTLFLDEIGEMDVGLQAKLLRFSQSLTFQRVGHAKPVTVDVRIICATNRDPRHEIETGRFREDLYYRLNVLPVHLAPLRERKEDVLRIAENCLAHIAREENSSFLGFTPEAIDLLRHHPWPGNVRQIQNTIRRAVVLNRGNEISAGMLQATLEDETFQQRRAYPVAPASVSSAIDARSTIKPFALQERGIIEAAVQHCGGNIVAAARALDISPSTIYRKMNAWQSPVELSA